MNLFILLYYSYSIQYYVIGSMCLEVWWIFALARLKNSIFHLHVCKHSMQIQLKDYILIGLYHHYSALCQNIFGIVGWILIFFGQFFLLHTLHCFCAIKVIYIVNVWMYNQVLVAELHKTQPYLGALMCHQDYSVITCLLFSTVQFAHKTEVLFMFES